MSKYLGSTLVAGVGRNTERNANYLLDFKWSDHIINSMEWLRADTFSWQAGSVYTSVYQHLVADATGTLQSETVAGVTVQFYLASDGHKICPANQETNVSSIYNATGVAWYYILDTANTRFKLPRTKFGFTGLRDTVGKYVEAGLPNITGEGLFEYQGNADKNAPTGAFSGVSYGRGGCSSWSGSVTYYSIDFDASRSNSIYGNSNTVQSPATQMYLYFYVGQFSQSAIEQTAGLSAELFNGKADLNLSNITASGKEVIAHNAMPSDRKIELVLGASGSTYTAPADGYIYWNGNFSATSGSIRANNAGDKGGVSVNSNAQTASRLGRLFLPVSKGDIITINYENIDNTYTFKFIYANGAQ